MKPEENDALWDLLGKADRKPEISPKFAQDLARQARQLGKPEGGIWKKFAGWIFGGDGFESGWGRPALAAGGLAVLAVAGIVFFTGDGVEPIEPQLAGTKKATPVAVEPVVMVDPVLDVFEDELDRIDQIDALLTVSDVDDLEDEEIAMLIF